MAKINITIEIPDEYYPLLVEKAAKKNGWVPEMMQPSEDGSTDMQANAQSMEDAARENITGYLVEYGNKLIWDSIMENAKQSIQAIQSQIKTQVSTSVQINPETITVQETV